MAQRILQVMTDDIDGTEIEDGEGYTVTFALDGTNYEIDLTNENAEQMRAALADFLAAARKVGRTNRTGKVGKRSQVGPSAALIRDWARSNGIDVPDRGRVPEHVRAAYADAN